MVAQQIAHKAKWLTAAPGRQSMAAAGMKDAAPVIAGLAPLGLAIGTAIADGPLNALTGWLSAPLIYGASAQLAAVSMMGRGAAGLSVITTVAVLGARSLFYSARLRGIFREQPLWFRLFAPYLLVDPLFVLTDEHHQRAGSGRELREYYLGAGLAIWAAWLPLVAAGIIIGPMLPAREMLQFAVPALLIGLLAPSVRARPTIVAVTAAAAVILIAGPLHGGGLLVATLTGAGGASLVERRRVP